ncbi:hypothetical protein MLD38_018120 [Melastoma candidum]|uniref:Uncharacterized protein n=1 Tax=Melastoma candidum TaxID=119954 RepID=A0ACB9QRZ0_9MYRT|nr:hypothetical protein MLD38_018120 [Melastoma candidum]
MRVLPPHLFPSPSQDPNHNSIHSHHSPFSPPSRTIVKSPPLSHPSTFLRCGFRSRYLSALVGLLAFSGISVINML